MSKNKLTKNMKAALIPILVGAAIFLLFKAFLFIGYVPTASMEPLIQSGSYILADRTAYWFDTPQVGDVIVFNYDGKILVKRVAAVGGDSILHNNRIQIVVPAGYLYLLGDNANASLDSRSWDRPFVSVDDVIAKYCLVFFIR